MTPGIRQALSALRASGCDADADRIESALASSAKPAGWMHEEDPTRVISAKTKAGALADAGASGSSVRPYSVPLYAHAPPAEPVELDYVPGLLDRTCPPKVWLQIDTNGDNEDRSEAFPESEWGNLSWCYEPIGGQEVVYIRADLVPHIQPAAPVESLGRDAEPAVEIFGDQPVGLTECPITGRKFFTNVEHPELGMVATYGGPFDSYTIPALGDDDELRYERYDWDAGHWVEGGEPVGYFYEDQQEGSAPPPASVPSDAADAALFRYIEKHVAAWHADGAELPRFVFDPRFIGKDGSECGLIVTGRDGVGTVSLRTALRLIQEHANQEGATP